MSELVREVTDRNFEELALGFDLPVVVDFWAPWCPPCRALAPKLEEYAEKLQGKVRFLKLNVDENPQTAERYQIQSIPALMLFKNGDWIARSLGFGSTTLRFLDSLNEVS